jgi:hypothetical protein
MKPMAYDRHKYSGELYKFVREAIGDTSELKYYYVGNISVTAGLSLTGKMTIKTEEPVTTGSLIKNIRDADGNLILDDQTWQVAASEPVLNAFNTIESYRLRVYKFQGEI